MIKEVDVKTDNLKLRIQFDLKDDWEHIKEVENKVRFQHKSGIIMDLFATDAERGSVAHDKCIKKKDYPNVGIELMSMLSLRSGIKLYNYIFVPKGIDMPEDKVVKEMFDQRDKLKIID